MTSRRLFSTLLALVVAIGLLGSPLGPTVVTEVRGAGPDLTITSNATYHVQPDKQRIRVTVDLTLTNHLKDTKTKRFYFDEAYLDVMPHSSGFKLTRSGSSPTVKATKKTDDYTRLRLGYPRLYSGKTAKYRLTFNLNDPGGAPMRDLRVGDSLVSFPVWAFATDSTPGSSVSVVFPAGYEVDVEAGSLPDPTTDAEGRTVFETGKLDEPLSFFAYLVADRPGAYRKDTIEPAVLGEPAEVVVRSWPDDEPWGERVRQLVEGGLPELAERIGLPWPYEDPLTVQEAVSRTTDGYAGFFDPGRRMIDVAYYADDAVVLHELAHVWFNGRLLADRWTNEGFASFYAEVVAGELDVDAADMTLTEELEAARIPLNAWGPPGREPVDVEDYAYAASLALATAIADRAGEDGLQRVWEAARSGIGAYQPVPGAAETAGLPDWRGLLDLLEERTDARYDDLWRAWVARPTDLPLLDARAAARRQYDAVVDDAADWTLPRSVRDALRVWRFEAATDLLDQATQVLVARDTIASEAADHDLIVPDGLRLAFQDDDGFDDALAEADAELAVIRAHAAAVAERPAAPDPFQELGLWGETPEADLDAARKAFAVGDLEASMAASAEAAASWRHASAVGQGRAFSVTLLALAVLLAIGLVVMAVRRRRAPRRVGRQVPMARIDRSR